MSPAFPIAVSTSVLFLWVALSIAYSIGRSKGEDKAKRFGEPHYNYLQGYADGWNMYRSVTDHKGPKMTFDTFNRQLVPTEQFEEDE